jgi:2-C-methyl-D-erythritol 4-phosphate cytidylyltransferase
MNTVIILAGGTGTRVGAGRPKQFIEVLGKPVLAYTCDIFQQNKDIDAIEIVCHHDWIDYCREMCERYGLTKVKWIVLGGETFQDSVINGVKHLESLLSTGEIREDDNVFIQYGGAPFTSQKIVNAVIEMTVERGSAVTATPCYQLLSERTSDTTSEVWCDRDKYIQIACPYGFRFSYLLDIYKRSEEQGLLETIEPHTTSLMYALGETINYAYGDQTNIKITTAEDVEMFEGYVLQQERHRSVRKTGQVIVPLADGFEECEALIVVDILRRAGIDVLTASINGCREVDSSRHIKVTADALIEDVDFNSAKMLFLPGGRLGTDNLGKNEIVIEQCRIFAKNKKLAAICAAPSILAGLELVSKAAVHPDFVDQMGDAEVEDKSVVVDENIITGQGLGAGISFALKLVEILVDKKTSDRIAAAISFRG